MQIWTKPIRINPIPRSLFGIGKVDPGGVGFFLCQEGRCLIGGHAPRRGTCNHRPAHFYVRLPVLPTLVRGSCSMAGAATSSETSSLLQS